MDARLVRAEARRIEVRAGIVSAACVAGSSGEVFFATEGGLVFRFDVAGGTVRCLSESGRPVASMAVDPEGQMLILLLGEGPGPRQMVHLGKDQVGPHPTYSTRQARTIDGPGDFWLTPALGSGRLRAIGIWNGEEMILLGGAGELTLWMRLPMPFLKTDPPAALLVPPADGRSPTPRAVLVHDGPDICQVESMGRVVRRRYLGWRPTLAEANTLRSAPLAWLQVDPERFELAGLSREGAVHWSSLRINDSELVRQSNTCSTGAPAYLAAGLARSGLVAGVTRSRVDWLRCGAPAFVPTGSAELPDVSALACFASRTTNELVVVGRDGTLATVPIPR